MTPVRNDDRFIGPDGEVSLLGLFAGRRLHDNYGDVAR